MIGYRIFVVDPETYLLLSPLESGNKEVFGRGKQESRCGVTVRPPCSDSPGVDCVCGFRMTTTPAVAIGWFSRGHFKGREVTGEPAFDRTSGIAVLAQVEASGRNLAYLMGSRNECRVAAITVLRVWLPSELAGSVDRMRANYPEVEFVIRDELSSSALLRSLAAPETRLKVDTRRKIGPTGKVRKATAGDETWYVKNYRRSNWDVAYAYSCLDVAAYQIQRDVGLPAPECFLTAVGTVTCSAQLGYKDAAALTVPYSTEEVETLQRHEILDRLLGNWDAHPGNFLRVPGVGLVGIDKTDSFAYYGSDRRVRDPRWKPCSRWPMTVYGSLWTSHILGEIELADPREFIAPVLGLSDDYLRDILISYADAADRAGLLEFDGVEPFLSAVRSRRDSLERDFGIRWNAAEHVRGQRVPSVRDFARVLAGARHV